MTAIDELRKLPPMKSSLNNFIGGPPPWPDCSKKKITPGANIRLAAAKLSLIEQEFPSPTYDPRVLRPAGTFNTAWAAPDGDGWSAAPGKDNSGHLLFGPYLKDLPPGGLHVANFSIADLGRQVWQYRRCVLDVYDARINRVLASVSLTVSDFRTR